MESVVAIICPRCRRPPAARPLFLESMTCSNVDCGHAYSRLDGTDIYVVLPERADGYLPLDAPVDFTEFGEVEAWIAGLEPGAPAWELALRTGMYASAHYEQRDALPIRLFERFLANLPIELHAVADLGCGVGGLGNEIATRVPCEVVAVDASGLALRLASAAWRGGELAIPSLDRGVRLAAHPIHVPRRPPAGRIRWLVADVHDPPLAAEAFDLVTAVNLFDSVADPLLALGQAAAMVRPGGYLLLAQPDAWSAHATPPDRWLASTDETWDGLMRRFGLELVDRDDGFEWELVRTPRNRFRYVSHARLARRIGDGRR